jgi:hypothetical protein
VRRRSRRIPPWGRSRRGPFRPLRLFAGEREGQAGRSRRDRPFRREADGALGPPSGRVLPAARDATAAVAGPAPAHAEVEMRRGRVSGSPRPAEDRAPRHGLAGHHRDLGEVEVDRRQVVGVRDDDETAGERPLAGVTDGAVRGGQDGRADRGPDVDPGVLPEARPAAGTPPLAEPRDDRRDDEGRRRRAGHGGRRHGRHRATAHGQRHREEPRGAGERGPHARIISPPAAHGLRFDRVGAG